MTISAINPLGSQCFTVLVSSPATQRYTVNLRAFSRNGSCTCATFTGFCKFVLKHQEKDRPWRCPHILAVRDYVMDNGYWDLVDQVEKIIELPTNERRIADLSS